MKAKVTPAVSPARLKAASNRVHARQRAAERYGINLTPALVRDWEQRIASDRASAVMVAARNGGQNRVLYALKYDGVWLPVIYDAATRSILSVLPAQVLDRYRATLERPSTPEPAAVPVPEPAPVLDELGLSEGCDDLETMDRIVNALEARRAGLVAAIRPGAAILQIQAELTRVNTLHREWRMARHRVYMRQYASQFGGNPDDPLDVLAALYSALGDQGKERGWDSLSEAIHKARKAAGYYLSLNGRANPSLAR